jgi:hypothetical protein
VVGGRQEVGYKRDREPPLLNPEFRGANTRMEGKLPQRVRLAQHAVKHDEVDILQIPQPCPDSSERNHLLGVHTQCARLRTWLRRRTIISSVSHGTVKELLLWRGYASDTPFAALTVADDGWSHGVIVMA